MVKHKSGGRKKRPKAGRKKQSKVSFKRGRLARALRDVLAKRIAKDSAAKEPFAVATSRIRRKGVRFWRRNLPKAEVNREWAEQKREAKRAKKAAKKRK